MLIRPAESSDAASIADIYNHYVLNSHATFEIEPLAAAEMSDRLRKTVAVGYPFLAAIDRGELAGYAYGHRYREREAYNKSVEVSVYVRQEQYRKGIGNALYEELIPQLSSHQFHTALAGIALPNDASIKLHERFGFQKIAQFREVGQKFDRWFDVGFWQLILS